MLDDELREFIATLKVDHTRDPMECKRILQDIATEVPWLSLSINFRRNISEMSSKLHIREYTRAGKCPNQGVMMNGKLFIGNYTGNKWHDESVKPYHDKINQARLKLPKPNNHISNGTQNNVRTLKKIQRKIEKLKKQKRGLESLISGKDNDGSDSGDDLKDNNNAGSVFGGKNGRHNQKEKDHKLNQF